MIRKQIYLEKAMVEQIKEISEKRNISQSEVIRQSITAYIKKEQSKGDIKDPLLELIGLVDEPVKYNADEHDNCIYGVRADE